MAASVLMVGNLEAKLNPCLRNISICYLFSGELPLEEEPPKPEVVVAERLRAPQSRPPTLQRGLALAGVGRGVAMPGGGLDALPKHVRPGRFAIHLHTTCRSLGQKVIG